MKFKHFTRKGYALFACLGREVLIGVLSVPTLSYAKAEGISVKPFDNDTTSVRREVTLDEVSITGSRVPMTALQSAKMVSVITRDDIHRVGAESVNDILKLVTGVDVRQRGGFGVQTDISINGGTFDQITILLNGMNISSPQTGHNAADFPVALDDIERIEVLEGAAARAFGSSAFNGAINIVTRPQAQSFVSVTAEGGSFGTFRTGASVNIGSSTLRNKLSGDYTQSDGGTLHSDFKRRKAFYQGEWSSRHVTLNWQAGMSSQDFGANFFYSAKADNQYEETRRYLASVTGDIRLTGSRLGITPMLYWHRDFDHYQYIRGMVGAKAGENYHKTDVYGGGINAHLSWMLGKTAIGADIRREKILSTGLGEMVDESQWQHISGTDRVYDHLGERTNTSLFAEHNVVLDRLTVSVGILANRNTALNDSFRFYPGIDISFRPNDYWKLYASWDKALRVPTYTDLYISNAIQQGDKALRPEKNDTYRIGLRYRHNGIEAVTSGFYSDGTDMIDWVYEQENSTKYHAMNIGELDNIGFNADMTLSLPELMNNRQFPITRIKVGYAYIHQRHETDKPIFKSLYALEYLRHKFVAQVDHRICKHLSATWNLRWQQRMNGYSPYAKLDGKVQWTASKYSLYIKADNITAHRYYDLGGILQPGLWIMAGGELRLNL